MQERLSVFATFLLAYNHLYGFFQKAIEVFFAERKDVAEEAEGDLLAGAFEVLDLSGGPEEVVPDGKAVVYDAGGDGGADGAEQGTEALEVGLVGLEFVVDFFVDDGHDGVLVGLFVWAGYDCYGSDEEDNEKGDEGFFHGWGIAFVFFSSVSMMYFTPFMGVP